MSPNKLEKFLLQDKSNEVYFEKKNKEKYYFNLRGFINNKLLNLKVNNIENIELDTFS